MLPFCEGPPIAGSRLGIMPKEKLQHYSTRTHPETQIVDLFGRISNAIIFGLPEPFKPKRSNKSPK